ncbi:hypothetical protein [uncultured Porphyromonas sp.]|uniref:hypothetical protein n=1 Tax=uncultured Porphyromonas sp. TaxID=159274 RepID=UPI0025876516|nr:hypothetical protein [uncultured Porphyromonas sp.]
MFKKVFLAALALIGSVSLANAQEVFHKGTTAINAGIGLGSYYSGITIPPLSVSLDYGVADNLINGNNGSISVGGFAGYAASSHTYGAYKTTFSYIALGGRGAFHYQFAPKLDTYAGLMLSYDIVSSNYDAFANYIKTSHVDWSIFLGGRYFFTEKIGGFAELGYGFYNLNLGVTFKL